MPDNAPNTPSDNQLDMEQQMRLDLIWAGITFRALADTLRYHSSTHYRWCEELAREAADRVQKWARVDPRRA
jgi:hypothetical protein